MKFEPIKIISALEKVSKIPVLNDLVKRGLEYLIAEGFLGSYDYTGNPLGEAMTRQTGKNMAKRFMDTFYDPKIPNGAKIAVLNLMSDGKKRKAFYDEHGWSLFHVVKEPTSRCDRYKNFQTNKDRGGCKKCYRYPADGNFIPQDLSLEEQRYIIRNVKEEVGTRFIIDSGGEPSLRFKDLVQLAKENPDITTLFFTNSSGFFRGGDIKSGLDMKKFDMLEEVGTLLPGLSIEDYTGEYTRRMRGKGRFDMSMEIIEELEKRKLLFGISLTPTRENSEVLMDKKGLRRLADKGAFFCYFFDFIPMGQCLDIEMMPTPEQRTALTQFATECIFEGFPFFMLEFWGGGPMVQGCIAGGRSYIYITADGNVNNCVFCAFSDDGGNIKDIMAGRSPYKSIVDFVDRSPVLRYFREKQDRIRASAKTAPWEYFLPCAIIDRPNTLVEIAERGGKFACNFPRQLYTEGSDMRNYLDGEYQRKLRELQRENYIDLTRRFVNPNWNPEG